MSNRLQRLRDKYRPSLGLISTAVIVIILVLPLGSVVFLRLYENLLIEQTEGELISQSAAVAAAMALDADQLTRGRPVQGLITRQQEDEDGRYTPVLPSLDLTADTILGPRPEAKLGRRLTEEELAAGQRLAQLIAETQRITLAGFRILSADGVVLAGRHETGQSLAHVPEVSTAMKGVFASVMRDRFSEEPPPALSSLSRGTKVRVFVAMPVIADGHVVGIIYASRTPKNVLKDLNAQRMRVFGALMFAAMGALLIGFIFVRTISRPIIALKDRAEAIARAPMAAPSELTHYGSREIKSLADSLAHMTETLAEQSDYIRTFAAHVSHELKSPLTAIAGASEVLQDDLPESERQTFLRNIQSEAQRLSRLLERLRDLAKADMPKAQGQCDLTMVIHKLRDAVTLDIDADGIDRLRLPITETDLMGVLGHLAENSEAHGATKLAICHLEGASGRGIRICDNGPGIPVENRGAIFDPFFTTRRDDGGTGMGLGIARALMKAHGGALQLSPSETGACFDLIFPHHTK